MSKEVVARLVVHHKTGKTPDQEMYSWQFFGEMPRNGLIGFIANVQMDLCNPESSAHTRHDSDCALMITFDTSSNGGVWAWCVDDDIPPYDLVGVLESIKFNLVAGQLVGSAQMHQTGLVDQRGNPILKR